MLSCWPVFFIFTPRPSNPFGSDASSVLRLPRVQPRNLLLRAWRQLASDEASITCRHVLAES
eukprot:100758-Amphidinium_carterae.1